MAASHLISYLFASNDCCVVILSTLSRQSGVKGVAKAERNARTDYRTDSPPTLTITDNNPMLIRFCTSLASAFRHGAIHEDKRNKFELIDLLVHITKKQKSG